MFGMKRPCRSGAFTSFLRLGDSSFNEITNGGATNDLRDLVREANTRNDIKSKVHGILPESSTLHGFQVVFVDDLSFKGLIGHWIAPFFELSGLGCCPLDSFKISAIVVATRSSSGEGLSVLW